MKKNELLLIQLFRGEPISSADMTVVDDLIEKNIITQGYDLTELGVVMAISLLPLKEQCQALDIEYCEIELDYGRRAEIPALQWYKDAGYVGVCYEGYALFTVLKAMMLDVLSKYNPFTDRSDACARYLEAQLEILGKHKEELVNEINGVSRSRFLSNFNEIMANPFVYGKAPWLKDDVALALYDALPKEDFVSIVKKIMDAPYDYRAGWPDLTLVKDTEVRLMEVKTKDRLHESQITTLRAVNGLTHIKFGVVCVRKMQAN